MITKNFKQRKQKMGDPITDFKYFSKKKALEALVWIAHEWPGVSQFFVAKILYFADRAHVNRHGRPILGDRYIAMDYGPVPSFVYDLIKKTTRDIEIKKESQDSLNIVAKGRIGLSITAMRAPDLDYLSGSDLHFLKKFLKYCREKNMDDLSKETHQHAAWKNAERDKEMNYEDMIDDSPIRENIIADVRDVSYSGLF